MKKKMKKQSVRNERRKKMMIKWIVGIFLVIGLPITSALIFWHLFKRMLNGFDVPDGEIEFWESTNGD
jgi:hypothetical protein